MQSRIMIATFKSTTPLSPIKVERPILVHEFCGTVLDTQEQEYTTSKRSNLLPSGLNVLLSREFIHILTPTVYDVCLV
jgi:hypothetical protein